MSEKRHASLMPLTHDHHHGLAHARRLQVAADKDPADLAREAREFVSFFRTDTIAHFREEEEVVFPLVVDDPAAESILADVMVEHLRIHALVGRLTAEIAAGSVSKSTAVEVAESLKAHIRFEEKKVFPLIERLRGQALSYVQLSERTR